MLDIEIKHCCTVILTSFCTLLGSAVATTLGKGFLAIRKAGHLCVQTRTQEYTDYSGREKLMEVRVDVLKPGDVCECCTVCLL